MPPPGIAGWPFLAGTSATIASVVTRRPATDTAPDLGRIDNPGLDHVDVLGLLGVEAEIDILLVDHAAGDYGAVEAGILGDLANRRPRGAAPDLDADLLVVVGALLVLEHARGIEQSRPAAGDDAFLDRGLGRMHGVLDPIL